MTKRGMSALALAALFGGTVLAGVPANAAEGDRVESSISGVAEASALHIRVLGTDLTLTNTKAEIGRKAGDVFASATAKTRLTPLFTNGVDGVTATKRNELGIATGPATTCTFGALDAVPGIERISDVGCPTVLASIVGNNNPSAQALGAALKVDLSVSNILDTLKLRETVAGKNDPNANDGLDDAIIDPTLGAIAERLTGTPLHALVDDTVVTVDNLLDDVLGLATTARLSVAPAVAEITTTDTEVIAHAKAQGLRLELLPLDRPNAGKYNGILEDLAVGEPLLTVVIGEAEGEQRLNRLTHEVMPATGRGAVARIKIGGVNTPLIDEQLLPLLNQLGLSEILAGVSGNLAAQPGLEKAKISYNNGEFIVEGPGTFTLLDGTLLETTIVLGAVDTSVGGFSGAGAKVHALKNVNDGILVALSDIAGTAGGNTTKVLSAGAFDQPRALARTGASPTVALLGMALLGVAMASRRLTTSRES